MKAISEHVFELTSALDCFDRYTFRGYRRSNREYIEGVTNLEVKREAFLVYLKKSKEEGFLVDVTFDPGLV